MLTAVALGLMPFAALGLCVVAHVVISRFMALAHHHGVVLSALAGLAGLGGLTWALASRPAIAQDLAGLGAAWILTYIALVYWYVFGFFNLGESARRIRLLIELRAAGDRGLTLAEILTVYNAGMIVYARLGRLLAGGQIVERDGRYFIGKPLMLYGAKALVLLKIAFLGAPSELSERQPGPGPR